MASCTVVNDLRGGLTIPVQSPAIRGSFISFGTPEEAQEPGDRLRFSFPATRTEAFPIIDRLGSHLTACSFSLCQPVDPYV